MNYRAAATGQLKDAPATKSGAGSGPANPEAAGDSPRMKANLGARSGSQAGGRKSGGAAMSYAATAAKKGGALDAPARRGASGRAPGSPPGAPPLTSLVGAQLELQLVDGSRVAGVLFTYDVYSGVVALLAPPAGDARGAQKHTVRLVKAANIGDVRVADGGPVQVPVVQAPSTDEIEARKARALALARERAARIGVGVSDHAQLIFEALSKTLPCRWDQSRIIVLDEISIEPPYTVDTCRELATGSFSLSRVKKVLQGELGRLGQVG
ncbi:hypothetical protein H4S02_003135 [Coemansia sp. RSA 2611]|nr:hypothetical protein IWW54_002698 [Coemansia sp. RSA 2705]KAJ2318148.1 hypothetical protein IWW52_002729 [Coemansia sp. RSA 2704]KAJ2387893.1 hypothetical protein H4S02_003135 [Coemansia sp. RSA 2611]KAJ2733559.1 hypothetical protein H4R23_002597 [Coemansia sp. Cherry 401B]